MRGISKQKADENSVRYRSIYDKWLSEDELTLEQLGEEYDITKLRIQNPILGEVKYSERFEKTTKKMFPTKKKKLKFLKSLKISLT